MSAMADTTLSCSREAIERANMQYLQEISNYISLFSNQKNYAAVKALTDIQPTDVFRKKHAREIARFIRDETYEPSQQFCVDGYTNLKDLRAKVTKVVNKYKVSE